MFSDPHEATQIQTIDNGIWRGRNLNKNCFRSSYTKRNPRIDREWVYKYQFYKRKKNRFQQTDQIEEEGLECEDSDRWGYNNKQKENVKVEMIFKVNCECFIYIII